MPLFSINKSASPSSIRTPSNCPSIPISSTFKAPPDRFPFFFRRSFRSGGERNSSTMLLLPVASITIPTFGATNTSSFTSIFRNNNSGKLASKRTSPTSIAASPSAGRSASGLPTHSSRSPKRTLRNTTRDGNRNNSTSTSPISKRAFNESSTSSTNRSAVTERPAIHSSTSNNANSPPSTHPAKNLLLCLPHPR